MPLTHGASLVGEGEEGHITKNNKKSLSRTAGEGFSVGAGRGGKRDLLGDVFLRLF